MKTINKDRNIFALNNTLFEISVKRVGAELCSIRRLTDGREYIWGADPVVWRGHAPVLFPIVGALKGDSYVLDGIKYTLPRHGFVRNNEDVELVSSTSDCLTFMLQYNQHTYEQYPFRFEFLITFTLVDNTIVIGHTVKNLGNGDMYFSLGGHPAFRCPPFSGEKYSDCYLEFEEPETVHTYKVEGTGLIGGKAGLILDNSRFLDLHGRLFDKGALIYKDLKSKSVCLASKVSGKIVQVEFDDFDYLGVWSKPNADFVCIEPWLGIADNIETDQDLRKKEGIIRLTGKSSFNAAYAVSVY